MGDVKVILFLSLLLLLPIVYSSPQDLEVVLSDGEGYDYFGPLGPNHWGDLNPKWIACKNGTKQSPISIQNVVPSPQLGQLQCDTICGNATLHHARHKIEVQWNNSNAKLVIKNVIYQFQQLHFHYPSEHILHGKRFDLEGHMVFQSREGKIAVIATLYEHGGKSNLIGRIIKELKHMDSHNLDERGMGQLNLYPTRLGSKYYRYFGSLTTPPCDEGVTWTIMSQIRNVTKIQVQEMKKYLGGGNARPLQKLNGRIVHYYNKNEIISQEVFSPSNNL